MTTENPSLAIRDAFRTSRGAATVVPATLAALTIALQILYPITEGTARHNLTIATVILFASASVSHAYLVRGARFAVRLVAAAAGVGLVAEALGVHTGVPFGSYTYRGSLGPSVVGVPVVIPLAWLMMAYPAAVLGQRIASSTPGAVLVSAGALAAWDLFLDPQMVAAGYWEWHQSGPALAGIPVTNYLGWTATAMVIQGIVLPGMPGPTDDRVPIALYTWTWVGSIVAHMFFLDLPLAAAIGGLGMGIVVLALARTRTR